jgi:hypothetical protein
MLYHYQTQNYQELNYIRQELNRTHHATTSLEAREKELCIMLQVPMSNSIYQQLEISREEYYNLVNSSKAQQGNRSKLKRSEIGKDYYGSSCCY